MLLDNIAILCVNLFLIVSSVRTKILISIINKVADKCTLCRAKIRNIEKTEEAKQRLHQERLNKKDDISVFVPTNIAVNFVQHNRCMYILLASFIALYTPLSISRINTIM